MTKHTIDDGVAIFPKKKRVDIGEERVLSLAPPRGKCLHFHGPFLVDEKSDTVKCGQCGERLNPLWVLQQLMHTENHWHNLHARYQDELKRLNERSPTKCRYCGQMTSISRG